MSCLRVVHGLRVQHAVAGHHDEAGAHLRLHVWVQEGVHEDLLANGVGWEQERELGREYFDVLPHRGYVALLDAVPEVRVDLLDDVKAAELLPVLAELRRVYFRVKELQEDNE